MTRSPGPCKFKKMRGQGAILGNDISVMSRIYMKFQRNHISAGLNSPCSHMFE